VRTAVAEAAGGTRRVEQALARGQRRKVEHAPVAAGFGEPSAGALGCEAVVAQMGGSGDSDRSASCGD